MAQFEIMGDIFVIVPFSWYEHTIMFVCQYVDNSHWKGKKKTWIRKKPKASQILYASVKPQGHVKNIPRHYLKHHSLHYVSNNGLQNMVHIWVSEIWRITNSVTLLFKCKLVLAKIEISSLPHSSWRNWITLRLVITSSTL